MRPYLQVKQFNKYLTFLGLYIAQSIPMSFFTTVVPVIMRQENFSLESIGMLQFVKLPWILKLLWAPVIDNKANSLGQYKRWIVGSELFYALIILSIGFFSLQTDFSLIVALVVIAVFASATQDIATDALAILTLKKEQRSMGNAIQSVGGFLGAVVGSGLLLLIYNSYGWQALLFGLAGFVLVALIPLKFFKYELREKPKINNRVSIKSILSFFTQKGVRQHLVFLALSSIGLTGTMAMLKPYMVDCGYTTAEIGVIIGIIGTSTAALMALLSAFAIRAIGIRKSLIAFSFFAILVGVYFLQMNLGQFTKFEITIGVGALWGVFGMMNVAIYTLAMNWARRGSEGTDFTAQIVVNQFAGLVIAGLSGLVAQQLNYHTLFIVEIILATVSLLYIIFVYKIKKEE